MLIGSHIRQRLRRYFRDSLQNATGISILLFILTLELLHNMPQLLQAHYPSWLSDGVASLRAPLHSLQNWQFDLYQKDSPRSSEVQPVTLITIDEKSLQHFGRWPWSRELIAGVLDKINQHNPAAIGIDIIFPEPQRNPLDDLIRNLAPEVQSLISELVATPSPDFELALALSQTNSVLATVGLKQTNYGAGLLVETARVETSEISAPSSLNRYSAVLASLEDLQRAAAGQGLVSVPNSDGVVREIPLIASVEDQLVPAFSIELLRAATYEDSIKFDNSLFGSAKIRVANLTIPTQPDTSVYIHYSPFNSSYQRYLSVVDLMNDNFDPRLLNQKIVILGVTGVGLIDTQLTALGEQVPGLEIHAQLIESMITQSLLKRPGWLAVIEVLIVLAVGIILIRYKARRDTTLGGIIDRRPMILLSAAGGIIVVSYLFGTFLFANYGILFSAITLSIGCTILLCVYAISAVFEVSVESRAHEHRVRLLSQQRQLFEDKSNAKSAFLASMSHELRTPLNAVIGYSQILLANPSIDNHSKGALTSILNSGRHLLTLINRVLDLSKIEAGKVSLEISPVDPTDFFKNLVSIFEIEQHKYQAHLTSKIATSLPQRILTDPERLTQILTNVVVNAFKYGNKGEVKFLISADETRQRFIFEVTDQGKGMTESQLALLFVPFEQANQHSEGAGLGMAIVNELLRLMNGNIEVNSKVNQGTQIRIEIPYTETSLPETETSASVQGQGQGRVSITGTLRVLVVDDNEENRRLLQFLLQPMGFELYEAVDGSEALEQIANVRPELVITDLRMPKLDGFELITELRSQYDRAQLPIIAVSASVSSEDREKALSLGANTFISKPFDIHELQSSLASMCQVEISAERAQPYLLRQPQISAVDWSKEINLELRDKIQAAAHLGQIQKIENLIKSLQDPSDRDQWFKLLQPALNDQDDEAVLDVMDNVFPGLSQPRYRMSEADAKNTK